MYLYLFLCSMNKAREKWTFEDEEELRSLFDQFKDSEGMKIMLVRHPI